MTYWGLRDYGIGGQIGLEATPAAYVAGMVAVFREVKRVLRPDGVVFCNIGDSYLPGKQLAGIPWRLAFGLQEDGWILRAEVIWSKPNPMPESVTDRPTKAHEQIFLLSKSERYYWDAEGVREKAPTPVRPRGGLPESHMAKAVGPHSRGEEGFNHQYADPMRAWGNPAGRNIRSVWTIPSHAYPGAHFATFPPSLAERCIRAGTSQRGACPRCGKAWVRVVETNYVDNPGHLWGGIGDARRDPATRTDLPKVSRLPVRTTKDWSPACTCPPHEPVPCVVFDPFSGAGTVALVAEGLGRVGIGCDLNPDYCRMALDRVRRPHRPMRKRDKPAPLFAGLEMEDE